MIDANAIARTIAQLAPMLPRRVEASRAHLARLTASGWPAGGGGTRSSGGHGDPVLGAIIARSGVPDPDWIPDDSRHDDGTRVFGPADVADWQTRTLAMLLAWLNALLDSCDRTIPPPGATPADRCSGHVDATCVNLRADDDPAHHGLCVTCLPLACHRCGKPHTRRRLPSSGEYGCDGCVRREQRSVSQLSQLR